MSDQLDKCPVCNSVSIEFFHTFVPEDRPKTEWWCCNTCNHIFANPVPSEEELAEFYKGAYRAETNANVQGQVKTPEGQDLPMKSNIQDETLRGMRTALFIARHGREFRRHLDVGSSTGALIAAVQDRVSVVSTGVEPNEAYRKFAEEQFVKATEKYGADHPSIGATKFYASLDEVSGEFDVITIIHTLEHLRSPRSFLERIRRQYVDNNGCLLVIEVPRLIGGPASTLMHPHLHAFTELSLSRLLVLSGFHLVTVETFGSAAPLFPVPRDLIIAATSKEVRNRDYWLLRYNLSREDMNRVREDIQKAKDYQVG